MWGDKQVSENPVDWGDKPAVVNEWGDPSEDQATIKFGGIQPSPNADENLDRAASNFQIEQAAKAGISSMPPGQKVLHAPEPLISRIMSGVESGLAGGEVGLSKPLVTLFKPDTEHAAQVARGAFGKEPDGLSEAEHDTRQSKIDKASKIAGGIEESVANTVNFFTSPIGIATLGIGAVPKIAQRGIALAFASQMASQTPEIATQLGTELGRPEKDRDYKKISALTTSAILNTGFTVAGAVHGLSPEGSTLQPKQEGTPNAIHEPTTEVLQPLREQPVEGAREMPASNPIQEAGEGGKPIAEAPQGEVPLKPIDELKRVASLDPTAFRKEFSKGFTETALKIGGSVTPEEIQPLLEQVESRRQEVRARAEKGDEGAIQEYSDLGMQRQFLSESQQGASKINKPAQVAEPIGMGAAIPAEFQNNPKSATSIKNAQVDMERRQHGLPPAVQPARKSFGTVWDEAMSRIDRSPESQDMLIDELRANPRALTDVEDAMLLQRQIDLQNEFGKATRDLAQAYDDGRLDDVADNKAKVAFLSDKLYDVYEIGKKVGTETGRGLNARKMMAFEDFSLAKMTLEKRALRDGKPLTEAENAEVAKLHEKIVSTQKAFDDYKADTDSRIAELEVKRAIDDLTAKAGKEPTVEPKVKSIAERIVLSLEKEATAARVRLKEKFARTSAGVDPTIIADAAIIGASHIARGALEFGKWSESMVKDIGEGIKPYLTDVWTASNARLDARVDTVAGKKSPAVKRAIKQVDLSAQRENAKGVIQERVASGKRNEITSQVQKLARLFVESGVRERDALIDAVHAVLKEIDPEFTRRETMDAISGYGDFKQLTKDEVSVELRDLKGQMQQVAKLEDITSKQPPLKTGVERRVPSDIERALIKQVNEAKRKFGIVVTDAATQLKSALAARKTYYENRLSDLRAEIKSGTLNVKTKSPSPTDAALEALKSEYAKVKEEHDAIFVKPGITYAQRLDMAIKGVERSIGELEQRIKEGDVLTKKLSKPSSPQLEALKAKRESLREQFNELRDLNQDYQREQHEKALASEKTALEKSIAEKERQIKEGDLAPTPKSVNRPSDPTLEPLKQRRDALSKQIAEARKKPASQKYADSLQKRLEAMNKAIAEKEAKIASGDVSTAPKKQNRPLPHDLEIAKQRLEALNKQISEIRNPKKSPEERALQSLKSRLTKQIENYTDKLARGDFSKKVRREIKMDSEANRLHFEMSKAKAEWFEGLMKERLANRTVPQKLLGTFSEILNTTRAVLTSMDLSAVLRQGGFSAYSHPIRALKAFPSMFKALRSKEGQHAVDQEILGRKNYPLYTRSKLYLSEHGQSLSKMEEAYMSRWAEKIPLVAASERAYTTFLNRLRADSFDAMANTLSREGTLTPEEANAISNFINVATGRGNLGMKENALVGLNTVFFSPRYVASRFQLLAGQPLYRGNARTRTLIAKEYARFLIGAGVVYGIAKLAGADVEQDPRSSDFGKLRFGNTRVDPMAGLLQNTVLISRLASGETKTLSGKVVPIRGDKVPFGSGNSADVIARFLRSKLAPVPGTAVNVLTGKDVVGNPVTPSSVAQGLLVPLSFGDIYQAMKEQGVPQGTALAILAIFGMGVQTYDTTQKRK